MPAALAILDPSDASIVHTDVTCTHLWMLAARVEAASGAPVTDPEALVDQAHADGLLVLDGALRHDGPVGGPRCCPGCRPAAVADPLPLAA